MSAEILKPIETPSVDGTSPHSKNVLVVDDDPPTREFLEMMLLRQGFNVQTVPDGNAALQRLSVHSLRKIDLVLLDMMMPGESGYEILKKLQHHDYHPVPIFIITGQELDESTIYMIKSEPNVKGFFKKPVQAVTLGKNIHETLGTQPRA